MLRTAALRLSTGAAAGATASQLNRSTRADARSIRQTPRTQATKSDTTERPSQGEEAWLEVSLDEDGVIFSEAEVGTTVEEIIGLCSEDEDSGDAAGEWIEAENSNIARSRSHLQTVLRASQRMASHPEVQAAAMRAMKHDRELRTLMEDISNMRLDDAGADMPLLEFDEVAVRRSRGNAYVTMMKDIGNGLMSVMKSIGRGFSWLGRMIKNVIVWMWNGLTSSARAVSDSMALVPLGMKAARALEGSAQVVTVMAMVILVAVILRRAIA